ncbi:hypothetical protein [Rubrivirga sp. IMCC43871]|uniref:hypothetical protein n=1 Tax=Rubrivirga sp. IMCC43871 TaxID=3391575 RepID=UPI00398FF50A
MSVNGPRTADRGPHLALAMVLALGACSPALVPAPAEPARARVEAGLASVGFNLDHLDFLGEDVVVDGDTLRLVHIYAEAPDWRFVGDDDEGLACVDDAARAAVVYLRHFALTGDQGSRATAIKLLRFVRRLQAPSGLFYNFVWDRALRVNTTHPNSVADEVSWWTARAVWALGEGARVLGATDPDEAALAVAALDRVAPHLDRLLARYPETVDVTGDGARIFPAWLVQETAADATSELLLGLVALHDVAPTTARGRRVRLFAEGLAGLCFGDLATAPYGGHASWSGGWHGWGNSQTQALAEAGRLGHAGPDALASARAEAETLYAYLLVEGWLHHLDAETGEAVRFEQIAYDVRPAAVGLVRLFEATGDERFAVMAGLAAAWFHGLNTASATMADPATGRGYDGVLGPDRTNPNAGAESTIEAQFTLLEVAAHPEAAAWAWATADPPESRLWQGRTVRSRQFHGPSLAVVVLDPDASASHVLVGPDAQAFLAASRTR